MRLLKRSVMSRDKKDWHLVFENWMDGENRAYADFEFLRCKARISAVFWDLEDPMWLENFLKF